MKHSIRQRVLDPVTGLMTTKIETVNGELGSGIFDKNSFVASDAWGFYDLATLKTNEAEVVGHVDD